jgi:hypothetical protein
MHGNNLNIDEKIKHAIELFKAGEDVQSLLNEINNSDELITWVYEYEGISLAEWFMYIRALPEFFYGDDDPREYYGDDFFKDFDTPQKKLNWIKDQASIYKECGCSVEFNEINGMIVSLEFTAYPGDIVCENLIIAKDVKDIIEVYKDKNMLLLDGHQIYTHTDFEMIRLFDKYFSKYKPK